MKTKEEHLGLRKEYTSTHTRITTALEAMQSYADQCVREAIQRRDEEIGEWMSKRTAIGLEYFEQFLSASSPSVEPSLPKELDQPERVEAGRIKTNKNDTRLPN